MAQQYTTEDVLAILATLRAQEQAAASQRRPRPEFDPNEVDPITPMDRETSARTVADYAASQALGSAYENGIDNLLELAGVYPFMRGIQNVDRGLAQDNPMQAVKGGLQAGFSVAPYTRAMMRAPITVIGGSVATPMIDDAVPSAQAATVGYPPLPTRKIDPAPPAAPQPEAPAAPQPPQPSLLDTFFSQIGRNVGAVGDWASGAANEAGRFFGGNDLEYRPPKFEDWARQNAPLKLKALQDAERLVAQESGRGGYGPKTQNAQEAATALRQEIEAAYNEAMRTGAEKHKERLNQPFAERNPNLSMAGRLLPAAVVAYMARRGVRSHDDAIKSLTKEIAEARAKGLPVNQLEDIQAQLLATRPGFVGGTLKYAPVGVAMAGVTKGAEDVYDSTVLPRDSAARDRARDQFRVVNDEGELDFSGPSRFAGDIAVRSALMLGAAATGAGLGRYGLVGKGGLTEADIAAARASAGIPLTKGMQLRANAREDATRILNQNQETDALGNIYGAAIKATERATLRDLGQRTRRQALPPPSGPQPPPGGPTPPPPGPGPVQAPNPGTTPNAPGPTASPPPPAPAPTPPPATGPNTPVRPASSFRQELQKKLTDRFVDNGGKLSKSDIQDLAPDIPAGKVKTYVENLKKAWQAAGKDKTKFEQLRQAFTGVKSIAITAPMAAAALAAAKREREQ